MSNLSLKDHQFFSTDQKYSVQLTEALYQIGDVVETYCGREATIKYIGPIDGLDNKEYYRYPFLYGVEYHKQPPVDDSIYGGFVNGKFLSLSDKGWGSFIPERLIVSKFPVVGDILSTSFGDGIVQWVGERTHDRAGVLVAGVEYSTPQSKWRGKKGRPREDEFNGWFYKKQYYTPPENCGRFITIRSCKIVLFKKYFHEQQSKNRQSFSSSRQEKQETKLANNIFLKCAKKRPKSKSKKKSQKRNSSQPSSGHLSVEMPTRPISSPMPSVGGDSDSLDTLLPSYEEATIPTYTEATTTSNSFSCNTPQEQQDAANLIIEMIKKSPLDFIVLHLDRSTALEFIQDPYSPIPIPIQGGSSCKTSLQPWDINYSTQLLQREDMVSPVQEALEILYFTLGKDYQLARQSLGVSGKSPLIHGISYDKFFLPSYADVKENAPKQPKIPMVDDLISIARGNPLLFATDSYPGRKYFTIDPEDGGCIPLIRPPQLWGLPEWTLNVRKQNWKKINGRSQFDIALDSICEAAETKIDSFNLNVKKIDKDLRIRYAILSKKQRTPNLDNF